MIVTTAIVTAIDTINTVARNTTLTAMMTVESLDVVVGESDVVVGAITATLAEAGPRMPMVRVSVLTATPYAWFGSKPTNMTLLWFMETLIVERV